MATNYELDVRYAIDTYQGQKMALNDLMNKFMADDVEKDKIHGAVALIREARQVLMAERVARISNEALTVNVTPGVTSHGPFPRLINPNK